VQSEKGNPIHSDGPLDRYRVGDSPYLDGQRAKCKPPMLVKVVTDTRRVANDAIESQQASSSSALYLVTSNMRTDNNTVQAA